MNKRLNIGPIGPGDVVVIIGGNYSVPSESNGRVDIPDRSRGIYTGYVNNVPERDKNGKIVRGHDAEFLYRIKLLGNNERSVLSVAPQHVEVVERAKSH